MLPCTLLKDFILKVLKNSSTGLWLAKRFDYPDVKCLKCHSYDVKFQITRHYTILWLYLQLLLFDIQVWSQIYN